MQDRKIDAAQSGETAAPDTSNSAPAKTGDAAAAATAAPAATGKKQSKFGQIVGGILGGALNVVAPGAGSLIGNLIKGGGPNFGSMEQMLEHSAQQQMQMLTIQGRMHTQTQEFTTISNLLKARHDSEMAAVNNLKS